MALKIKDDAVQLIRDMRGTLEAIRTQDAALHDQIRRALTSIPLNIAEGEHKRGGNARLRFETAMGSVNEVRTGLETAAAYGYVEPDLAPIDTLDRIARTLNRVMRR